MCHDKTVGVMGRSVTRVVVKGSNGRDGACDNKREEVMGHVITIEKW